MHRQAIYNRLVAQCPSLTGGINQPYMAKIDTPKPYAVLKIADENPDSYSRAGMRLIVQVFVYADKASFLTIDNLVSEVIAALHNVDIETTDSPPEIFRLEHRFTSSDFDDEERRAISKRIDFEFAGGR